MVWAKDSYRGQDLRWPIGKTGGVYSTPHRGGKKRGGECTLPDDRHSGI